MSTHGSGYVPRHGYNFATSYAIDEQLNYGQSLVVTNNISDQQFVNLRKLCCKDNRQAEEYWTLVYKVRFTFNGIFTNNYSQNFIVGIFRDRSSVFKSLCNTLNCALLEFGDNFEG